MTDTWEDEAKRSSDGQKASLILWAGRYNLAWRERRQEGRDLRLVREGIQHHAGHTQTYRYCSAHRFESFVANMRLCSVSYRQRLRSTSTTRDLAHKSGHREPERIVI